MTTEEFVHNSGYVFNDPEDGEPIIHVENVVKILKEYAKLMCNKQKEICLRRTGLIPVNGIVGMYLDVDKECIINSPYPEELQ